MLRVFFILLLFFIFGCGGAGEDAPADSSSGDKKPPTVPTFLVSQSVSQTRVNLTWNPSMDDSRVIGYNVFRNGSAIAISTTTSYSDANLSPDTTYTYSVSAFDAANNESGQSQSSQVTTGLDTTPPVLSSALPSGALAANTTDATLSLNSNESANCRYATISGTSYSAMSESFSTTGGATHQNALTGLQNGESYTYFVRCEDSLGNENLSDYSISFSIESSSTVTGDVFYVAEGGVNDISGGDIDNPWGTIGYGLQHVEQGDVLYVRAGSYNESISFPTAGAVNDRIILKAYNNETVTVTQTGRVMTINQPYITVENIVFDGNWGTSDIVSIGSLADYLILRGVEIKNTRRDAVDMTSPTGVLIDNSEIHDAINVNGGIRTDAHGIVTTGVQNLTIRDTEIYYVSGDTIQLQYGGWDNVLIEDCTLWNGPLPTARGGAPSGVYPGENAIDTKYEIADGRGRLTINNTTAYGWRSDYITNASAFNLKHNIEATLNGITTYDNEIAFRTRGLVDRGEAWVTIMNAVIYDTDRGIRYEDSINNLHIYNVTFGSDVTSFFQSAGGHGTGFEVKNNLFLAGSLPSEATLIDGNLATDAGDFVSSNDYHLDSGSSAINAGIDLSADGVLIDRDGITRPQQGLFDVGAYEYQ